MNWNRIEDYYKELIREDIYPQPNSNGHTLLTKAIISRWLSGLGCENVLDVGCGQGFAQPLFEGVGISYTGIALGRDVEVAKRNFCKVLEMDMHSLEFPDNSFDLILSRHSLEHSPMPLLALFEMHRVARKYLCVVLPNPGHTSWNCPNHYGIMTRALAATLLERAGWHIFRDEEYETEFWYLCEKRDRRFRFYDPFVLEEPEKFDTFD